MSDLDPTKLHELKNLRQHYSALVCARATPKRKLLESIFSTRYTTYQATGVDMLAGVVAPDESLTVRALEMVQHLVSHVSAYGEYHAARKARLAHEASVARAALRDAETAQAPDDVIVEMSQWVDRAEAALRDHG